MQKTLNTISRRKAFISISDELRGYLHHYGRLSHLPALYRDLKSFSNCYPLTGKDGKGTLWDTVVYERGQQKDLWPKLTSIYSLLKTGDLQAVPQMLSTCFERAVKPRNAPPGRRCRR